jgi:hypothetical protein
MIPLVIEKIILINIYEMKRHLKFKKCLDQIESIQYIVNNNMASCRMIHPGRSTNYYRENIIELWIHKHVDNKEYVSIIHDLRLFIDIIHHNCVIHSL